MIVGRNPRLPVIGDTVLLRVGERRGVGTIVDTNAIGYKVYWRNGRGKLLGMLAKSWPSPDSTTNGDGRDVPVAATAHDDSS
jgi:hypothetical protein